MRIVTRCTYAPAVTGVKDERDTETAAIQRHRQTQFPPQPLAVSEIQSKLGSHHLHSTRRRSAGAVRRSVTGIPARLELCSKHL
ncbi:hypothetical protein NDU88_005069 [Pleurodeles waltl]|uniref:Uncharacterized protein n=1 Tax=Pleurodeles waltl TaxID=8319 RepID=A0AAV7VKJ9_PLEWA|nr:hypothetical protein NDU88_005069 [Pleurodeles waltl]